MGNMKYDSDNADKYHLLVLIVFGESWKKGDNWISFKEILYKCLELYESIQFGHFRSLTQTYSPRYETHKSTG